MRRGTIRDAHRFIAAREDFDCGNLYGGNNPYRFPTGYMPNEWVRRYRLDNPTYVVYSYGTPIAWVADDGREVVPYVTYSVSTTRHQGQARQGMPTVNWWKLREPAPYEVAA
jgi:hypothetical protein